MKTFYPFLGVCLLSITWAISSSAKMVSPSFKVPCQVINSGGLKSASEHFRQISSIGQPAIGFSQNASLRNHIGFIPQLSTFQLTICGDADNNGTSDIFDALLIAEYDARLVDGTQIPCFSCCNVDGNEAIDIFDALRIAEFAVGIFPVLCE